MNYSTMSSPGSTQEEVSQAVTSLQGDKPTSLQS